MKNQSNEVRHDLEVYVFKREITPGEKIEIWNCNIQIPKNATKPNVGDTMIIQIKNDLANQPRGHWQGIFLEMSIDKIKHLDDSGFYKDNSSHNNHPIL